MGSYSFDMGDAATEFAMDIRQCATHMAFAGLPSVPQHKCRSLARISELLDTLDDNFVDISRRHEGDLNQQWLMELPEFYLQLQLHRETFGQLCAVVQECGCHVWHYEGSVCDPHDDRADDGGPRYQYVVRDGPPRTRFHQRLAGLGECLAFAEAVGDTMGDECGGSPGPNGGGDQASDQCELPGTDEENTSAGLDCLGQLCRDSGVSADIEQYELPDVPPEFPQYIPEPLAQHQECESRAESGGASDGEVLQDNIIDGLDKLYASAPKRKCRDGDITRTLASECVVVGDHRENTNRDTDGPRASEKREEEESTSECVEKQENIWTFIVHRRSLNLQARRGPSFIWAEHNLSAGHEHIHIVFRTSSNNRARDTRKIANYLGLSNIEVRKYISQCILR